MSTNVEKKNWPVVIFSILLMVGGSILLSFTINILFSTTSAFVTLSLSLLSVFIYIFGASLFGRGIKYRKAYHVKKELTEGIKFEYHIQKDLMEGTMFAFFLIAIGALMVCFNTELLNPLWKKFFLSWQMLVFVIGAISICRSHFIWGSLLTASGIFFLIRKATVIYPNIVHYQNFTSTYWPVMFIVVGVIIVLYFFTRPKKNYGNHSKGQWTNDYIPNENENNDGKINYRFVLSGTEQVILDPVFKGGTIETVLGGMELDLRHTSLPEGKTILYVNTILGGIEITAPADWEIELVSKSFAGGVVDERISKSVEKDSSRILVIVAKCTLGGITIK